MTTSDLRGVSKNNPAKPLPVAEPHDAGRAEGEETMASTSGCKLVGLGGWWGAQQPPSPFLPWLLPEPSQRFVGSGGGGADSQREGGPTAPQPVSRNGGLDIGCQERLGGSGSGGWGPLEWIELAICG